VNVTVVVGVVTVVGVVNVVGVVTVVGVVIVVGVVTVVGVVAVVGVVKVVGVAVVVAGMEITFPSREAALLQKPYTLRPHACTEESNVPFVNNFFTCAIFNTTARNIARKQYYLVKFSLFRK
jgi:hypothetical protein